MGINKCWLHSSVQQEKKQTYGSEQKHFVMVHGQIPAIGVTSVGMVQILLMETLGILGKGPLMPADLRIGEESVPAITP